MTLALRTRLAVLSTLVFALLLAGVSVVSYRLFARSLDDDITARLTELTDGLHGYLRFDNDVPAIDFDADDSSQAAFVQEATRYYQIYDAESGRVLTQSPAIAPVGLLLTPSEVHSYLSQPKPFDVETDFGRLRLSNSIISPGEGRPYLLQVGVPLTSMDAALSRYRDLIIWRLPLALGVAMLVSWWSARLALTPLARVAIAAKAIDIHTLGNRLPTRGARDELDDVANAFNETLARLDNSVAEMRQFSTALAHELRTPLAALRGEIELTRLRGGHADADDRAFVSQIEEIDRLRRLIDQILTLSRAESGQIPLAFTPLNLSELARSLVEQLEPVAQANALTLRCDAVDDVIVDGDAGWLRRLIINLIDNALKFTPPGGAVIVRVSHDSNHARLDVEDTGIGLTAADARRVFERFFRADPSRSSTIEGAGIGLSLVRWIAERHHGRVTVASRPGEGSTFTVELPIVRANNPAFNSGQPA